MPSRLAEACEAHRRATTKVWCVSCDMEADILVDGEWLCHYCDDVQNHNPGYLAATIILMGAIILMVSGALIAITAATPLIGTVAVGVLLTGLCAAGWVVERMMYR
jgi:hypothetical protein